MLRSISPIVHMLFNEMEVVEGVGLTVDASAKMGYCLLPFEQDRIQSMLHYALRPWRQMPQKAKGSVCRRVQLVELAMCCRKQD